MTISSFYDLINFFQRTDQKNYDEEYIHLRTTKMSTTSFFRRQLFTEFSFQLLAASLLILTSLHWITQQLYVKRIINHEVFLLRTSCSATSVPLLRSHTLPSLLRQFLLLTVTHTSFYPASVPPSYGHISAEYCLQTLSLHVLSQWKDVHCAY